MATHLNKRDYGRLRGVLGDSYITGFQLRKLRQPGHVSTIPVLEDEVILEALAAHKRTRRSLARAFEIVRLYFRMGMAASDVARQIGTTEASVDTETRRLKKIFASLESYS